MVLSSTKEVVPEWRDRAACSGLNTTWFIPHPDGKGKKDQAMRRANLKRAKYLCEGCPVKKECLEFSISFDYHIIGVWGGLTEEQRRKRYTTTKERRLFERVHKQTTY